jgi:hypothetical protein
MRSRGRRCHAAPVNRERMSGLAHADHPIKSPLVLDRVAGIVGPGHPDDPDNSQALAAAGVHRSEWLHGYRDCWGFVCLVLRPASG